MQAAGALPNVELNNKPQIKNANYNFVKKNPCWCPQKYLGTRIPLPLIIETNLLMELLFPGSFKQHIE